MTEYIDITPTWEEILPTWLMLYENALRGRCNEPEQVLENAKQQLTVMARAADKWNAHCKEQKG